MRRTIAVSVIVAFFAGFVGGWLISPNQIFVLLRDGGKSDLNPQIGDFLRFTKLDGSNEVTFNGFPGAPQLCREANPTPVCTVQAEGQYSFSCKTCIDPGVVGGHTKNPAPSLPTYWLWRLKKIFGFETDVNRVPALAGPSFRGDGTSVTGHPFWTGSKADLAGIVLDSTFQPQALNAPTPTAGLPTSVSWARPVTGDDVTAWNVYNLKSGTCTPDRTSISSTDTDIVCNVAAAPQSQYYCVVVTSSSMGQSKAGRAELDFDGHPPPDPSFKCQ